MKMSIKNKLVAIFVLLVLILLISSMVLSRVYLGKYYVLKNKQELIKLSNEIGDVLNGNRQEIRREMREKYNVKVETIKLNQMKKIEESYEKNERNTRRNNFVRRLPKGEVYLFIRRINKEDFEKLERGEQIIKILEPFLMKNKFIILTRKLNENELIILSKALFPINQSAKIASNFFVISSLFTLVVGMILIMILSPEITKPILKLNKIAQKMTKFDFSQKSDIKSGDEIEELGNDINKLSLELERKINELSLANEKLKEDIEKEREIERKRKAFISNISHELKTPIAIIGGYAEGLKDNVIEDEESKLFYAETIMDETKNMTKLVKELLELSKLDSDGEKLEIEEFDIIEILKQMIEKYKFMLNKTGIKFDIENSNEKIYLKADREKIKKVLNNYISNAIKNVNENGEIKIRVTKLIDTIRVEVENTGSFIPEDKLEEIWTPFYKMDTSRNREKGGTGLGLAIVKSIIRKHKGKVGVENLENGIKFWFKI